MGGFYTTSDLAHETGVARGTVVRWIREGHFPGAFRRRDRWRIPYNEAETFMSERSGKEKGAYEDDGKTSSRK